MTTDHKVLFVGHDATRTGAPLVLLSFLQWLRNNTSIQFEILLREGGPLVQEYEKLAKTRVATRLVSSLGRKILRKIGLENQTQLAGIIRRLYPAERYPLAYVNTITNGSLVLLLADPRRKIIGHAHEMRMIIERWGGVHVAEMAQLTNHFIAASAPVKRDLMEVLGVPEEKIEIVHPFSQRPEFAIELQQSARLKIRADHGFDADTIVVGMCGTSDWRKGADLFPQLAQAVSRLRPNGKFRFLWIGTNLKAFEFRQVLHDVKMLGLEKIVTFVPSVPNPHEYFSAMDLFALTSREDPFPLVMLEAAALGAPIVCFAGSGGATEFVGNDSGVTVPYLDITQMAAAIVSLGEDENTRKRLGRNGQAKSSQYSISGQSAKLLAIIQRHLATPPKT